MKVDSTFRIN